jgi:hypothetical protein
MKKNNIKNRCGGKRGCSITDYTMPYGKHNSDIINSNLIVHINDNGRRNVVREIQQDVRIPLGKVA